MVDVDELRCNTKYTSGFEETSQTIQDLWSVVSSFTQGDRGRFLAFVTGSKRVPIGDFKLEVVKAADPEEAETAGDDAKCAGAQSGGGKTNSKSLEERINQGLPRTHTCFNQLILPAYTKKGALEERLRMAIDEALAAGFMLT